MMPQVCWHTSLKIFSLIFWNLAFQHRNVCVLLRAAQEDKLKQPPSTHQYSKKQQTCWPKSWCGFLFQRMPQVGWNSSLKHFATHFLEHHLSTSKSLSCCRLHKRKTQTTSKHKPVLQKQQNCWPNSWCGFSFQMMSQVGWNTSIKHVTTHFLERPLLASKSSCPAAGRTSGKLKQPPNTNQYCKKIKIAGPNLGADFHFKWCHRLVDTLRSNMLPFIFWNLPFQHRNPCVLLRAAQEENSINLQAQTSTAKKIRLLA